MKTAALLAFLAVVGYVFTRLTHHAYRHKRLHPNGLNSDPDQPLSILQSDQEKR
jgi:hypothetical protein